MVVACYAKPDKQRDSRNPYPACCVHLPYEFKRCHLRQGSSGPNEWVDMAGPRYLAVLLAGVAVGVSSRSRDAGDSDSGGPRGLHVWLRGRVGFDCAARGAAVTGVGGFRDGAGLEVSCRGIGNDGGVGVAGRADCEVFRVWAWGRVADVCQAAAVGRVVGGGACGSCGGTVLSRVCDDALAGDGAGASDFVCGAAGYVCGRPLVGRMGECRDGDGRWRGICRVFCMA